jgi:hypothetical protein
MASTERLHALLQSILAERDRFAAHLYQSRREYRKASETAGKSGCQTQSYLRIGQRYLRMTQNPL